MARVAIVTGGSRGIGEAISVALKEAGFTVAANYAGNDERAKAFTDHSPGNTKPKMAAHNILTAAILITVANKFSAKNTHKYTRLFSA